MPVRTSAVSADEGSEGAELPLISKDCESSRVETASKVSVEAAGSAWSNEVVNVSHMGVDGSDVNMRNACISSLTAFPMAVSFQLSAAKVVMCSSIDEESVYFCFIMVLSVKNAINPGLVPWCTFSSFSHAPLAEVSSAMRSSFSLLTYSMIMPRALSL